MLIWKEKDPHKWDNFTKEELKRILDIYEDLIEDKDTKKKFNAIYHEKIISVSKMCQALEVSRFGYYSWIKNGKKANFKFDKNLLKAIEEIFYNYIEKNLF